MAVSSRVICVSLLIIEFSLVDLTKDYDSKCLTRQKQFNV